MVEADRIYHRSHKSGWSKHTLKQLNNLSDVIYATRGKLQPLISLPEMMEQYVIFDEIL